MVECDELKIKKCEKQQKICNKATGRCNKIVLKKEKICPEGKILNPVTGRCNKIKKLLTAKKSLNTIEKISKLKKIWKKVKLNNANENTAEKKRKAFDIVIKHLLPFVTKTFTLKNRIKYAKNVHKGMFEDFEIKKLESKKIPAEKFKIIKKDNYYLNNIHLYKKIGSESVYGTIYNVKYKHDDNFYNICGKIMCDTKDNRNEIQLIMKATEKTMNNETPHFPIMYFNSFIQKDTKLKDFSVYLPKSIKRCNKFIVNFNEMFSGDLKIFMEECKHNNNKNLLINTLEQIFICILTFHKKIKLSHNDCHWGNFLYHKIKPGGYIHYNIFNKDIYLENKGYLWIIWDYGLTSPLYDSNKYVDYYRILNAFISYEDYGWNNKLKYKINRAINIFDNIPEYKNNKNFENKLFNELFSYHTPVYVKPPDSQIINLNKPYIL